MQEPSTSEEVSGERRVLLDKKAKGSYSCAPFFEMEEKSEEPRKQVSSKYMEFTQT